MGRGAWYHDGEIELGYSGALRSAATIVADDPLFGWVALGGELQMNDDRIGVIPRDGLRQRCHVITAERKLHLLLERDGFAASRRLWWARGWIGCALRWNSAARMSIRES